MALKPCVAVSRKLHHFYEVAGETSGKPFPIRRHAELALALGCRPATITEWVSGIPEKGRPPNLVQEEHLAALAGLVVELTRKRVSLEEAEALWREASPERFRDGLLGPPARRALDQLLDATSPQLTLRLVRRTASLGMLDDMVEPPGLDDDHRLKLREPFQLELVAEQTPGAVRSRMRSVYVLCDSPEGLHAHVPGGSFDGVPTAGGPVRIPPERPWRFTTVGAHQLVVIALSAAAPPTFRPDVSAVNRPLEREDVEQLARALLDPSRTPWWTWGGVDLYVHE